MLSTFIVTFLSIIEIFIFKISDPRRFGDKQALEVDDLIFKGKLKGRDR